MKTKAVHCTAYYVSNIKSCTAYFNNIYVCIVIMFHSLLQMDIDFLHNKQDVFTYTFAYGNIMQYIAYH